MPSNKLTSMPVTVFSITDSVSGHLSKPETRDVNEELRRREESRRHKLELEAGWAGKIFGTRNPAFNIIGCVVILALVGGLAYTMIAPQLGDRMPAVELWKYLAPIITGGMGYMFGKSKGDSE